MDDKTQTAIDVALSSLARDVADGTPRPGPDLLARVLADAGAIRPEPEIVVLPPETKPTLSDWLFGWTSGAVATLCLCLALGIGVGFVLDASQIPLMGEETQELALNTDGNLFSEEFL